jgi:hypothetical protein
MKKILLVMLAMGVSIGLFAQYKPTFTKGGNTNLKALKPVKAIDNADNTVIGSQAFNPFVSPKSTLDDPSTMVTTYDLQTNGSMGRRTYLYSDGTIGAVATFSATTSGTAFPDRGTGYNYFNGTAWGTAPTARLESIRTGWPEYCPFGATGEIFISHNVTTGASLLMGTRTTKGTGTWNITQPTALGPPSGAAVMAWPRMVTNGPNHNYIHIIALTEPTANGGTTYQGLDGAILYIQSTDGGVTWTNWQLLPGMTSSQYLAFSGDDYAWAEPHGDTLCFTVGSNWVDQFIMKSVNNGTSWTKTIVWQCAYDLWPGTTNTDTFYCSDGNSAVALDKNGNVHLAFGRQRAVGDNTGAKFYFPFTDGLIYWHEGMAQLPQSLDVDSIFVASVPDTMVFYNAATQLAYYYNSMTSQPQLHIDNNNNIYLVYSTVTMLLDPNSYMLRHLYSRGSTDGGVTWKDWTYEITQNFFQYHWEECVFPSISPTSTYGPDGLIYIPFQGDLEAGDYLKNSVAGSQGQVEITNNDLILTQPRKDSITGLPDGIVQKKIQPAMYVTQNSPNPVKNQTIIDVMVNKPGSLSMEVYSLVGQKVFAINRGSVNAGEQRFILNASQFTPGVYFYTVRCNNESSTHKMIVE